MIITLCTFYEESINYLKSIENFHRGEGILKHPISRTVNSRLVSFDFVWWPEDSHTFLILPNSVSREHLDYQFLPFEPI